jgi:hypothetical protein
MKGAMSTAWSGRERLLAELGRMTSTRQSRRVVISVDAIDAVSCDPYAKLGKILKAYFGSRNVDVDASEKG